MDSGKLSIDVVDLNKKRVLMRVDFNVPLDGKTVSSNQRIVAALPSIRYVLDKGCSVVLMSHLGRPDGSPKDKFSLKPVADELSRLLERPVTFLTDCVGSEVELACASPAPGSVILLENLRFHAEEEGKGKDSQGKKVTPSSEDVQSFRSSLTKLGDVYINDAFGTAHRAHSSMVGIDLPIRAGGFLMKKELTYFGRALENPKRPFLAILGGGKAKDKIKLIHHLLDKVDEVIVTGVILHTFLKGLGEKIGNSRYDKEGSEIVKEVMMKAKNKGVKITLATDLMIAYPDDACSKETNRQCTVSSGVPDGWMAKDIGDETISTLCNAIENASTIVWNGNTGIVKEHFFKGSQAVLTSIVTATKRGATSIIGGGGTAFIAEMFGMAAEVSHVSTGGGSSLQLLEGKVLPGMTALTDEHDASEL